MSPGEWRFVVRQMGQRPSIRLLTIYSWSIAVTGVVFVALVGATRLTPSLLGPLADSVATGLLAYVEAVVVALAATAGAVLAQSPVPGKATALLDVFSERFSGDTFRGHVRPIHGALLLAKLALVVPVSLTIALLLNSKRAATSAQLLPSMFRLAIGTLIVSVICGIFAVWLSRRNLRWPLLTWLGIWLIPEGLRVIDASIPTCRSILLGLLSLLAQPWGAV